MEKSVIAVFVLTLVFLAVSVSSIRVELQTSPDWSFSLHYVESFSSPSSFFIDNVPNSLVVIYTPTPSQYTNCSYQANNCVAPRAALNSTSEKLITLNTESGPGCKVNLLVRVKLLDQHSEEKRKVKNGRVIGKIKANKADFHVFDYTTSQAHNESLIRMSGINLRVSKMITPVSSRSITNHECNVDLILLVQHKEREQESNLLEFIRLVNSVPVSIWLAIFYGRYNRR